MNPFDETANEMKRQSEGPKRLGKAALQLGTTAATVVGASTFAPILAKAAPFLSQYIPENLAIKGLSKIHPKLGKFVQDALKSGYDFDEVKTFIGDKINKSQQQESNIIQKESPDLHQFIDQEIKKGRKPIEAAALAQNDKKFASIIKKLMKDHKTSWSQIVESIYGSGQTAPQPPAQPQQNPLTAEAMQPPGSLPQGPPSAEAQAVKNSQAGPGQQAITAILQKINQNLGP